SRNKISGSRNNDQCRTKRICYCLLVTERKGCNDPPTAPPRPTEYPTPNLDPTPCPPRMFCASERLIVNLSSFNCQCLSRLTARSKSWRANAAKSGTMLPEYPPQTPPSMILISPSSIPPKV